METFSTEIYQIIEKSKNIIISTHQNPDGDAVGSVLALALVVEEIGHKPIVLLEKYSEKYDFISGKEYIYNGNYDELEPDLFISVDCSVKNRLGDAEAVFDRANITFNFDHHVSNTEFAQHNVICPNASSSCEVVYDIVKNFSVIRKDIAEALYTGILTDTAGFKNKSTTAKTMETASRLIDFGVDFSKIQNRVLYEHSKSEVAVFLKALQNYKIDEKIAYTVLSANEIKQCNSSYSELDGIVGYLLDIKDIEVSVFIYEKQDGSFKASLRSKNIDVNKVASIFGGGGHVLAAGASISAENLNEAAQKVISEIKKEL